MSKPIVPDELWTRIEPLLPKELPKPKGGRPRVPDRGKPGTKRQIVTDRRGIPLAMRITGADRHDSAVFEEVIDAIRPIRRLRGRPRKRPGKLHDDKAYDIPRCRRFLHRRHIKVRIARKGIESREKLGRHRWVVERTMAWLAQFQRLTVRYERRADIHEAFLSLGWSLVCFKAIQRFC